MNFNFGFYPIYALLVGVNWSKTEFDDVEIHQLQIALLIFMIEIEWEYWID